MKKIFAMMLTIAMLVSLSACNRTDSVPDQLVVFDVEEKFSEEEYEYTITHEVDNDNNVLSWLQQSSGLL